MKYKRLNIILLLFIALTASAEDIPTTVSEWADRLTRFGKAIPQEKVYVHTDNSCYFLGDTIWFKAYTRRTDLAIPSNVSGVLYADLLNQDGYLVERQLIKMTNGEGWGAFALKDTLYAGFYELRAYTRWQLNWGQTEHPHTANAEKWFYSKEMAKEYYRDYDKLYSRVFPVYDRPKEPGKYYHDMTLRPLRRYFKDDAPKPALTLSLFPEGGNLVGGLPCRIAFEAVSEEGETRPGTLAILENGNEIGRANTINRGRGIITITADPQKKYEAVFTDKDGVSIKTLLPKVEVKGVTVKIEQTDGHYYAHISKNSDMPMALTVMHEGVVEQVEEIVPMNGSVKLNSSQWPAGIHQLTLFDADGRIWADRLFFITKPELFTPSLTVGNIKTQYEPFEQITLDIKNNGPQTNGTANISLSVKDATNSDYLYDNGNIMTEMLLASELKGFIPQPDYFFEKDDEEHRTALDLLMMTQGWRRFNWHEMATPGAFELTQPAESMTQVLKGQVMNYTSREWQDDVRAIDDSCPLPYQMEQTVMHLEPTAGKPAEQAFRDSMRNASDGLPTEDKYTSMGQAEIFETIIAQSYAHEMSGLPSGSYRMRGTIAAARFNQKESSLDSEMLTHAEFVQDGSDPVIGDVETKNGNFTIQAPRFDGYCVFFLSASDQSKWKTEEHQWISMNEQDEPEFYLRIQWPYPNFVKPYDHYQMRFRPTAETGQQPSIFNPTTFETQMQTVTVRASHGGLRRIDPSKPAFTEDAYEAYNRACDAGLMEGRYLGRFHYINSLARLYLGDMNTHNAYLLEPRYDGANISKNRSGLIIDHYNLLSNLQRVKLYTDYNPRTGGDPRAIEQNVERVSIDLEAIPDEGQRVTYRDRRYVLQGFSIADEFYHPDYRRTPPAEGMKDYRRTLYWNPNVQLDENGQAAVSFFTGSKAASINVEANGQAADGTLLTN